ncbi:hypothetical protein LTR33_013692 [Friedmanniomyces endolithicus]|nr:hypothetical protein LTR33_013692 [Friedmanniomyces endolithicus]
MLVLKSLAVLAGTSLASAANLTVSIPSSPPLLPNPSSLAPSTHAVLIGPPGVQYEAPIRRDNTFTFPDLAEASYLLTVHGRDYFFPPLRVDVTKAADGTQQETVQAWQTFRGNEWSNKGPFYGSSNVDPEMKEEFDDMQKKGPLSGSSGAAAQLRNFDIAGWLAGKGSTTEQGAGDTSKKR